MILPTTGYAQQIAILDTIAWITVTNDALLPDPSGERFSKDPQLNALFAQHDVVEYHRPMAFAKTKRLRQVCEIKATSDLSQLFESLDQSFPGSSISFSLDFVDWSDQYIGVCHFHRIHPCQLLYRGQL